MQVYALIVEAHSDDDRLIGLYSSVDAARTAYALWEDRPYFQFYRIERRELDGAAFEWEPSAIVFESHDVVELEV